MADVFDFYVYDNRSIVHTSPEPIMQEDKDVAVWRFRIPKVLNNIDMSAWAWWFVYVNAKNQKFSELLTLTNDIDDPENFCTADYSIGYGISKTPGGFTFALEAISAEQGGEISGEWHTRTYTHTVTPTLQGNQAEYTETESDIISALIVEVQNKINSLIGGATPLVVSSVSAMTDTSKIYVLSTDGNWYYHNGTTWVSGGTYASGITIDPTLTQSGQAADAKAVGDALAQNDTILDVRLFEGINKVDPSALTNGRYLYNGTFQENASYKTTDYITINTGDVIAFYKKINAAVNVERNNGERLALFDASKNYLGVSGQYPIKTDTYYTVENASARYIRLSYSASLGDVELTINQTVNEFSEYVPATLDSIRLAKIERNIGITTSSKIIDCWGDSRTDMNDDGTSYCDYLQTLLGGTWIVQNRGISGQASGQVAARFGSNEVFLTLENNQVPVSGSALITAWKVSTGTDTNLRGGDATYGVHGIINGVSGKYIHTTGGNINFVRDYDGVAVKVKPRTKIVPDPYFNAEHCQILWCGKNDFSYAYPNVVSGITGNYNGMVGKIPHDKFIILGETNGIGDTYLPGHSNRGYVDSINTYLAQKYPDNFIDIQAELIADGLTLEGITPTSADTSNIANGWIPDSLMADETHPNQYGREAIAKIIYAWMQEKGWA